MTEQDAIERLRKIAERIWLAPHEHAALNMAIEALATVKQHEETFEWCEDCKEYDPKERTCHRWCKVIRNQVEEIKEGKNDAV